MMYACNLDALALSTVFLCLASWALWRKRTSREAPFPPGPRGLPIVGNILDMPGKDEWEAVRQWGEQYGNLVSVKNFGTRYLFINSYEAAVELLEKRGAIYSSRPRTTMVDLEGWSEWHVAAMPYGDELRNIRQLIHRFFQQSVTKNYYGIQTQSTHNLLCKLLDNADAFRDHIKHSAAESIISIAYGYEGKVVENDPYVELLDKGQEAVTEAAGFFLVNALPVLSHLPTWFPGTGFHDRIKEGHELCNAIFHGPYDKAKRVIANGTAAHSITSRLIDENNIGGEDISDETVIAKVIGAIFAAGGDTTVSILLSFFLAMVLYPDTMRKGQEELDRVVGNDTLPTFEDRQNLPYINAICSECFRWQTVAPLGLPHCAEKDDVYDGYSIPAGTTVFANVWAMLRNPKEYPEPDKFIPERWLASEPPLHVSKISFGFGRRICPGIYFAENAVFIGIASILAVFDIQKAVDSSGVPITPVEEYTSSTARYPKPFKCKITPRSQEAAALIQAASSELIIYTPEVHNINGQVRESE